MSLCPCDMLHFWEWRSSGWAGGWGTLWKTVRYTLLSLTKSFSTTARWPKMAYLCFDAGDMLRYIDCPGAKGPRNAFW